MTNSIHHIIMIRHNREALMKALTAYTLSVISLYRLTLHTTKNMEKSGPLDSLMETIKETMNKSDDLPSKLMQLHLDIHDEFKRFSDDPSLAAEVEANIEKIIHDSFKDEMLKPDAEKSEEFPDCSDCPASAGCNEQEKREHAEDVKKVKGASKRMTMPLNSQN